MGPKRLPLEITCIENASWFIVRLHLFVLTKLVGFFVVCNSSIPDNQDSNKRGHGLNVDGEMEDDVSL